MRLSRRRCRACRGVVGAQQPAGGAGQVDRGADAFQRGDEQVRGAGGDHRLAADEHDRAPGPDECLGCVDDLVGGRHRGRDVDHGARPVAARAVEHPRDPQPQVGLHRAFLDRAAAAGGAVPLPDHDLVVEQVDGQLDEHRARDAGAAAPQRLLDGRADLAHAPDPVGPLDVRAKQRHLVDVLQRAATLQHRRGGPAEQYQGRLRELGVLHRGDRVGQPGARGDGRDARTAGQPGDGIGGEHGGGLVPGVDDADAAGLGAHQDRRDVPAAQGENGVHPMGAEHLRDEIASVHCGSPLPGAAGPEPTSAAAGAQAPCPAPSRPHRADSRTWHPAITVDGAEGGRWTPM